MNSRIDVEYEFHTDTPSGKDPDSFSPTLRQYHRRLWSKPLPSGQPFTLTTPATDYLRHQSALGTCSLASDAITTRLKGRAAKLTKEAPTETLPSDLGYTIGSSIIFPGNRIDGAATINGARGFHPRIADRFDLTLECIRRHYQGESSPLEAALQRYADFFGLFESFTQYVEFFILQDLWDSGRGRIKFLHHFDEFSTPAVPKTPGDLVDYLQANNELILARNNRITRTQE